MDLLFSILPKDYYVKVDFLDHMESVCTISYLKNVKDLINNFKKVKVEDLLKKMYASDDMIKINFKLDYIRSNIVDMFIVDAPFAILHGDEESTNRGFSESEYESCVQDIIELIEKLYENVLSQKIDIDKYNFMEYIDSYIEPDEKQKHKIYLIYLREANRLNTEILNYILICYQIRTFNIKCINRNKEGLNHIRNRIKIFFKVVGSDFSKLIKQNIHSLDPFCLTFIKFNKLYIFDLKDRIDILDDKELCILLYFLCIKNDSSGSFIELFTYLYQNKFKTYSERSIKLHR